MRIRRLNFNPVTLRTQSPRSPCCCLVERRLFVRLGTIVNSLYMFAYSPLILHYSNGIPRRRFWQQTRLHFFISRQVFATLSLTPRCWSPFYLFVKLFHRYTVTGHRDAIPSSKHYFSYKNETLHQAVCAYLKQRHSVGYGGTGN